MPLRDNKVYCDLDYVAIISQAQVNYAFLLDYFQLWINKNKEDRTLLLPFVHLLDQNRRFCVVLFIHISLLHFRPCTCFYALDVRDHLFYDHLWSNTYGEFEYLQQQDVGISFGYTDNTF